MNIKAAGRCLSVALLFSFLLWTGEAPALSGTLSAQDLIRLLNDYTNSGNARKQALAAELQQRLTSAGVSLTNNGFVITAELPGDPNDYQLLHCDNLLGISLGSWVLSRGQFVAPSTGPTAGQINGGVMSVLVDGNATTLGFSVTPGSLSIGLAVGGSYAANVSGSMRWEQGYFDPLDPICHFNIFTGLNCVPRWKCTVLGNELYNVGASGSFSVRAALNLDVVLERNASGRYQIVIGRQVLAYPAELGFPLSTAFDLSLSTSIQTSFLPGAPLWAAASSIVSFVAEQKAREKLTEKFAETNADIREQLPVVLELPQIDPSILKLVVDIVHSPILTRFIEQNFTQIVFYILVNDREALTQLVASTAACEATRLARASMAMPSLYTNVSGSCEAANPEGPDAGRYFANSTCTHELAFQPMPQSEYCNETLAPTPNALLGNAAAWTPDANQPNDPLPSAPSRKWTVPQGPQMAITAESLSGKTAPMMKRVRWRDIAQSFPISNLTPLYWGCLQSSYDNENGYMCIIWGPQVGSPPSSASFLGYIKTVPEPGTVPLYWVCAFEGESGCASWEVRTSTYTGASPFGYAKASPDPGTLPLWWTCTPDHESGICWNQRLSATAGTGSLLGHMYAGTSLPRPNCVLEMRVYKKNPTATGLTPLIAFHGGSWQYRGAAFTGFEAEMAHFTESGFVVFAPFYRLAGTADGNADCNQAPWEHVVADADAALDWVKAHGHAFGAKPGKPAVAGMSAGAHLAGWLVTHRPTEVAAGMLLYPPSDVRDFLVHGHAGGLYEPWLPSLDILSKFYGSDVRAIDLGNPPEFVRQNSFHDLVRAGGGAIPPVFMLHGVADTLVPSNQSVQLCNAYGGTVVNDGGGANRRATYTCGASGSRLHLFQQAEHPLDICVINEPLNVCFSGDNDSRVLVASSMAEARNFLVNRVNHGPIANAGADLTVVRGTVLTLEGTGTDPDGTIVSYAWTQAAGPAVTLLNAGTANATFAAPHVSADTLLTFRLTVTDNNGNQDSDTVNVAVTLTGSGSPGDPGTPGVPPPCDQTCASLKAALKALPAILQFLLED
jgi:acetyl esterase/lipase